MYKHVLIPVAFDHENDLSRVLEIARALADPGARMTALHVMDEIPAYVAQYLPEGQIEKNRKEAEERLAADFKDVPGTEAKVITGHPAVTIIEYAEDHGVDCIVIASHRPGLQDYFLGSTAARVVRHAPCSVHVYR